MQLQFTVLPQGGKAVLATATPSLPHLFLSVPLLSITFSSPLLSSFSSVSRTHSYDVGTFALKVALTHCPNQTYIDDRFGS